MHVIMNEAKDLSNNSQRRLDYARHDKIIMGGNFKVTQRHPSTSLGVTRYC